MDEERKGRWFGRAGTLELASLQKDSPMGISTLMWTCIGAWRLYDAIEAWFNGDQSKLRDMKLDTSKWATKDTVLVWANRMVQYQLECPFTRCAIAAYKQLEDRETLLKGGDESAVRTRHARYREVQNGEVNTGPDVQVCAGSTDRSAQDVRANPA